MRLLILYETVYPDFIGGVELRNHEVAAALCRRGHQVTMAGFCGDLCAGRPNLHIHSLGRLGSLYNRAGKRSTRQALRFAATVARLDLAPYDVVETPNMPYIHLLPLAWKCARAGKPLIVTWHEYWGPYWRGYVGPAVAPAYRAIEWLTAQLGSAVVAVSDLTRERLAAARRRPLRDRGRGERDGSGRTGDGADAIPLIPNGITVARVQAAAATPPRGAAPLLYAGRLLTHKRLDLLLEAVQRLVRDGGGGTDAGGAEGGAAGAAGGSRGAGGGPLLTIFGEGPDRERLEALARRLGIAGRVAFRGHVKSSEEVWSEMGGARLAVQPSAREGFGIFPLEAMAAGLPVVYCESPESAVGELVRDGVEGVATAPEAGALAAALAALLGPGGAGELRRLTAGARARAARYDWDEIGERIEELGLELIARRNR